MVTYDSGADGHYLSEADRRTAGLPILKPSTKQVSMANGSTSHSAHVTCLPFPTLSPQAAQADSFTDFPHSLMSNGKTADDKTVSIFMWDGITIHDKHDVLITCQGALVLSGVRDTHGCYCIPLVQTHGQWQPCANPASAPMLPSTTPTASTTFLQPNRPSKWLLFTAMNVLKYYPETIETPKGHLNQTRENVRSTKPNHSFKELHSNQLRGCKERNINTKVYNTRDTIFTNQTGKFPACSQTGHQYITIMVKINSSAILIEPIKNRKDAELILSTMPSSNLAKHILDNEISQAMKDLIPDKYHIQYKLAPPGCHCHNAAEEVIRNFKCHFRGILVGVANDSPLQLWDTLLPQTKITLNLLCQSNATSTISAYAHLCGPFDYNKMPLAPLGGNV
eukprot:CCRYP_014888-RA/>CCRYP_014888-RA protein AED:0.26 eAED:0.26 QI:0/-1/0/1/-1/1/1/0/393